MQLESTISEQNIKKGKKTNNEKLKRIHANK